MISYRISLDLGARMELSAGINAALLPLVNQAVHGIAQATAANWREAVYRAKLWSGEKDAYASSINMRMTGDFSAMVEADYKHAEEIESGRPARDLKRMLDTSMKVRRWRDGTRFLIIPMRHNVDKMPDHVQAAAKTLTASRIIDDRGLRRAGELTSAAFGIGLVPMSEKRQRRSPFAKEIATRKDVMVTRFQYSWGAKLAAGSMGPNPRGKVDRFAGMYRFDTSASGAPRSTYLTFRVMSEKSRGWIVPAQPGQHIAQQVARDMQPLAEKVLAEAVRRSFG